MARQSKDQAARELAGAHYAVDPGIKAIFRLTGPANRESDPREPIKLLEVNSNAIPVGIRPLFFGADQWTPFPSVIVDVSPDEYKDLLAGKLTLPNGWTISVKYPPHKRVVRSNRKPARKTHRSPRARSRTSTVD